VLLFCFSSSCVPYVLSFFGDNLCKTYYQFIDLIILFHLINKFITTELFMAYTEEQTSVNKLMENEKVGKGNYARYNWNIVESGVKYHNPNPSPLHVSAPKDQVIKWVYQWNYWNDLVSFKSDIISLSKLAMY
jgi:hypothetical protein